MEDLEEGYIRNLPGVSIPPREAVMLLDEPSGDFIKALALAKLEFPVIRKTKLAKGKTFSYHYADLSDVLAAVNPVLSKHGFILRFKSRPLQSGGEMITSILDYCNGGRITSSGRIPQTNDPQDLGSYKTYMKRYLTIEVLGLHPDEDDDGRNAKAGIEDQNRNQSHESTPLPQTPRPQSPVQPKAQVQTHAQASVNAPRSNSKPVTDPQITRLFTIAYKSNWTNEQIDIYIKRMWNLGSTKSLTMSQYDVLCEAIIKSNFEEAMVNTVGKIGSHQVGVAPDFGAGDVEL